jgi:membrane-bound serine protease (ClpP class)
MKGKKDYSALLGKIGVTESELTPCGIVSIDNEIYEVKTDGESLETGRGVKVIRVRGKNIFVRRV